MATTGTQEITPQVTTGDGENQPAAEGDGELKALVTGATERGGIGYEAAKMLAAKRIHTILAGSREMTKEVDQRNPLVAFAV